MQHTAGPAPGDAGRFAKADIRGAVGHTRRNLFWWWWKQRHFRGREEASLPRGKSGAVGEGGGKRDRLVEPVRIRRRRKAS